MTIAIFALLFLGVAHFIYEGILAPTFRLSQRFKLFELRDEARNLKIDCQESLNDHHFDYLHDNINFLISVLYRFDCASLALAQYEAHRDPEFKKRAEERARILDDCNIPQARELRRKSLRIAANALAINSGGCAIYVFPVAMAVEGLSAIKRRIRIFASLSGQDFKRVSPDDSMAVSPS